MAKATLTKRDQFAGYALIGLMIAGNHDTADDLTGKDDAERTRTAEGLAKIAYLVADSMIDQGEG